MKKRYLIPIIILVLSAMLVAAGRLCKPFADFYADNIFPVISTPYAFLSGLLPFSLGEMMVAAVLLLYVIGIPILIIMLIFAKKLRKKAAYFALTMTLWILTFVAGTEALNCFTLYGCTRFSERFFTSAEHNDEQLKYLFVYLANECNELSERVPRDENGQFTLTTDYVTECRKAMKKASEQYPQLKGYYPKPKPIMFSYFMSQTGTLGMYFPFSMESTYNNDMVSALLPSVVCHEYSHLKGFMQEDECNFISFIATNLSDDPQVRYSGMLDALEYVYNQLYESDTEAYFALGGILKEEVCLDMYRFVPEDYWEENEEKEIIPTETVEVVSDAATDTSMKLNGVEDGIKSYSRMVDLLLDYYFPAEAK